MIFYWLYMLYIICCIQSTGMNKHKRVTSQQLKQPQKAPSHPKIKSQLSIPVFQKQHRMHPISSKSNLPAHNSNPPAHNSNPPPGNLFQFLKTQTTKLLQTNYKRSVQKKSTVRYSSDKPTLAFDNEQAITTKQKLMRLIRIYQKGTKNQQSSLQELWASYQSHQDVIRQWKTLRNYDQIDDLVSRLVKMCIIVIEKIVFQHCQEMSTKLLKYQRTIQAFQIQNSELRQANQQRINWQKLAQKLQQQLWVQKQKAQWSSFAVTEINKKVLDFQSFVKQQHFYQNWVANSRPKQSQNVQDSKNKKVIRSKLNFKKQLDVVASQIVDTVQNGHKTMFRRYDSEDKSIF